MVSEIPSREKDSRPPVTTKVSPAKVCGKQITSSAITRTPAALHLRIISRCQSILNQSMIDSEIVDPKNFKPTNFVTKNVSECIIPPNSFVLARTVEKFKIPDDVLVICLGKSTYARCGIIVNVTPLEPGWEGYVTLEFSKPSEITTNSIFSLVRVIASISI